LVVGHGSPRRQAAVPFTGTPRAGQKSHVCSFWRRTRWWHFRGRGCSGSGRKL